MSRHAALPPTWTRTTLGAVCSKPQYGWTTSADNDREGVRLLRTTDITSGSIDWATVPVCRDVPDDVSKYQLKPGDIVISRAGSVGFSHLLRDVTGPAVFASYLIRFRPNDGIDGRFLSHFFWCNDYWSQISEQSAGIALANVNARKLEEISLPLAPLPEQRRIVAKIEELFSDLNAGVAALERVRANLKRYRATVLKAAVDGRLGSDESTQSSAPWKPIGEVIHDLEQGWSPKCESVPAQDESEWAVMTTTAIQPLRFCSDENKRLPKTLAPRTDLEVYVGDMMITRAGPRSRAGVACLVRSTRKRLILCDKAYRFQCDDKQVRGRFLEIALNADPVLRNLEKMKTGISDSGVNLTQPRFRELMVPVPTLVAQDRIVAEVDRRLSVADAAETQVEHALQRAARLRQAILKRAFEGKLVPQDPTDEPAAALLDRIKGTAARSAAPSSARRRRRRSVST